MFKNFSGRAASYSISNLPKVGNKGVLENSGEAGFFPYAEDADFVLKKLKTNKDTGLNLEEIMKRRTEYGFNEFKTKAKEHLFVIFLKQFKNPLAVLLITASIIAVFLKEYSNAIIILFAVLINSFIGFIEERKMSDAFSKLKDSLKKYAVVVRNGRKEAVEAREIVPGDIIIIKEGEMVPADARILEEKGLTANESILTGEWLGSEKTPEKADLKAKITEQSNMVFMGTLIVKGWAKAVAVSTGHGTEFGKIASLIKEFPKKETPFQKNIKYVSRFIGLLVVSAVATLFFIGILQGKDKAEMFLSAVAIAVAAVPEGLPIAVSVILVLGMKNILKRGGLARNLSAIEVLGSADIILTDKTGTLTYAKMKVSHIVSYEDINIYFKRKEIEEKSALLLKEGGALAAFKLGKKDELKLEESRARILEMFQFVSESFIENPEDELAKWVIRGDDMEKAILEAGIEAGMDREAVFKKYEKLDFLPFDSERRFTASIHKFGAVNKMFLSGAPETVLSLCSRYSLNEESSKKLLNPVRQKFLDYYEKEAGEGARMIALAVKEIEESEFPWSRLKEYTSFLTGAPRKKNGQKENFFSGLTFYGFMGFHDPVREDVKESLALAKEMGVEVKIITGDNANTAAAVALRAGILSENAAFLDGDGILAMGKEEIGNVLKNVQIVSRVLPAEKLIIVEALQAENKIVAMTGDGINDTPALNRADIGISLASGTDAAKEASDIVLLNNNFKVIVEAIREGRIIIENIRKVITYLLSTGFSEIILIGGSIIAGFPLPVLPQQILWANIVQEGFMNFAYAFEREGGKKEIEPSPRGKIFTREMKILIFVIGIITDIFLLILFFALLKMNYDLDKIRTIMFVGLSSDAIFFALSLKSLKKPIWKINIFSNIYLIFSLMASVLMLYAALSLPFLRNLLELTLLSGKELLIIFTLGIINLISIETAKLWMNKKRRLPK